VNSSKDLGILADIPPFQRLAADFTAVATQALCLPIDQMLLSLYQTTAILTAVSKLPDPEAAEAKLYFMLEKAKELNEYNLDALITYFGNLYDSDHLDIEFARPYDATTDAIRLMSIHKSKGLEFPIVYYPGLDKKFNFTESKAFFIFDSTYGLITKAVDQGFKDTILHVLVKRKNYRDYVSERIRLFYVALTRAREKVILLLNTTKEKTPILIYDERGYLSASQRLKYRSYQDLLFSVPANKSWHIPVPTAISISPHRLKTPNFGDLPIINYTRLQYPLTDRSTTTFSQSLVKFHSESEKAAMAEGTRLHRLLELVDYADLDRSIARLPEPIKTTLLQLFKDDRFAKVYQEYEFYEESSHGSRHGVIDLMFEYPDHVDILDYKLQSLDDPAYLNQLNGYCEFVHQTTLKPVHAYLLSLTDGTVVPLGGAI